MAGVDEGMHGDEEHSDHDDRHSDHDQDVENDRDAQPPENDDGWAVFIVVFVMYILCVCCGVY